MTTLWLRSILAALALSAPLAACTQPVDTTEEQSDQETVAAKPFALTAVDAKFARWLPTPNGKIAGMMLDNGSIVHFHPEAITDASAVKAGDAVRVEGVQKDAVFKHASVTKDGNVLVKAPDFKKHEFKKGEHKKHEWKHGDKSAFIEKMKEKHAQDLASLTDVKSTGTIEAVLPGRHGGVHGFVLSDGTVAYAPHHSNVSELGLKKGDSITLAGKGGSYDIGKSMIIESVTLPSGDVKKI
jgi:hypothetical protein